MRDIWQCLKAFWYVRACSGGEEDGTGLQLAEVKDAAKQLAIHTTVPDNKEPASPKCQLC